MRSIWRSRPASACRSGRRTSSSLTSCRCGDVSGRSGSGLCRATGRLLDGPRRPDIRSRPMAAADENPLAAGLEREPIPPTTLVIFGVTGDLARRKLLPAIYNLAHEGSLPDRFNLIGVARGSRIESFEKLAGDSIAEFSRTEPDSGVLQALLEQI